MPSQTPIASDLSYFVVQKRRERGELGACALDSSHQRLYAIPSLIAHRRRFIPDVDQFGGDSAAPVPLVPAIGETE
jgi:hypothetical protein